METKTYFVRMTEGGADYELLEQIIVDGIDLKEQAVAVGNLPDMQRKLQEAIAGLCRRPSLGPTR